MALPIVLFLIHSMSIWFTLWAANGLIEPTNIRITVSNKCGYQLFQPSMLQFYGESIGTSLQLHHAQALVEEYFPKWHFFFRSNCSCCNQLKRLGPFLFGQHSTISWGRSLGVQLGWVSMRTPSLFCWLKVDSFLKTRQFVCLITSLGKLWQ